MYPVSSKEESENIIKKAIPLIQKCIHVIKEEGVLEYKKIVIYDKIKSAVVNPLFYKKEVASISLLPLKIIFYTLL